MEEIRRVLAEIQEERDPRMERTERTVEHGGGGAADLVYDGETREEYGCATNDDASHEDATDVDAHDEDPTDDGSTDEDDDGYTDEGEDGSTDEYPSDADWNEDSRRLLPYCGRCYPFPEQPHCAAGARCTIEEAESIIDLACERDAVVLGEWLEMSNNNIFPLPPAPLQVLPNVTVSCVSGDGCYHQEYWTDSPATTAPAHPYFRPCRMMQVFSLRLPRTFAYPVQVYGTFAVRDCWEPLCNYVFNCTRDDPATMLPGCSSLPLCGPCRGIYVLKYVLIDIDLWIKEEGEMSGYKQLFRGYLEFDADLSGPKSKVYVRIPGGCYDLELCYGFLSDAIETAIEVFAVAKHSLDVKMSAFTGSFDDEVVLYDGTLCDTRVINHFVFVRKRDELHVLLQVHGSQYR
ncbi:hypothetical protein HU200_050226 [Digitaria exilis]|uniref:DUF6598 domain-containing protein n=1 Tax=Digitaria exilis TaxID=1010633 RepID=A0A835AP77_9POAL|nr:hypothetical protein HU200_050226 [Digitaria exilis]